MYFNVFINTIIGISPSHVHCNVSAMHTHLHICFSLYTMTSFPTYYTTTFLFFHAHWSIPTFIQSILTFHIYTSPHIPHSMSSLVARSIAEPKLCFIECIWILNFIKCSLILLSKNLLYNTWKNLLFKSLNREQNVKFTYHCQHLNIYFYKCQIFYSTSNFNSTLLPLKVHVHCVICFFTY